MDNNTQIHALFVLSLFECDTQGARLRDAVFNQFPAVPCPREPMRLITKNLGIAWARPSASAASLQFFRKVTSAKWFGIAKDQFITELILFCKTPRLVSRVLSRIDSYTRWILARLEGVERARENIMRTQERWVDLINNRIGGADLAGISLEVNRKFVPEGPFISWPLDLQRMLPLCGPMQGQKIPAIKKLRELTGMGLADAKKYIERAYEILFEHGAGIFLRRSHSTTTRELLSCVGVLTEQVRAATAMWSIHVADQCPFHMFRTRLTLV